MPIIEIYGSALSTQILLFLLISSISFMSPEFALLVAISFFQFFYSLLVSLVKGKLFILGCRICQRLLFFLFLILLIFLVSKISIMVLDFFLVLVTHLAVTFRAHEQQLAKWKRICTAYSNAHSKVRILMILRMQAIIYVRCYSPVYSFLFFFIILFVPCHNTKSLATKTLY